MTRRTLILDTDPGQDDAIALLLALGSDELQLDAVTTVAGNVPQPLVTNNSLGLLALAGREDVPVYRGCERPMLRHLVTAEHVHGATGVDGAELPTSSVGPEPQHAVDALIDRCLASDDGSVTLCPIGPLTNIGMAIVKEPSIVSKIREIVWMGGAFDEGGNTTELAEFNAYVDPHAAHVVFTSGAPITVFPLDVTHKALMLPRHVEALERFGTPISSAAVGMLRFYERYDVDKFDMPGAPLHDPCAVAYLVDPTLFSGHAAHVAVDHVNETSMGNTYEVDGQEPNAMVMTDVDADRFFQLVISRVGSL
ncbi:MAG: nucleoside hydrolase [Acidimicrobiia bacterium]|nr:MAG: nucleoside hydrolase [Acidimicrobiia bacterium]